MNRRLFWKILIVFCVMFFLTFQLTWIAFSVYVEGKNKQILNHMPTKVDMIAQLLHVAGEEDTLNFIAHLPERERVLLSIKLVSPQNDQVNILNDELESPNYMYQRSAVAPDGTLYSVSFKKEEINTQFQNILFNMPMPITLAGIFVGLTLSLTLAWNLTKPMRLLRQAFFQVSQGNLSVRLFDKLEYRHDEISEVGKDFDMMV
ncbi:MAG: HAMP domain-containing protein, partial [Gilliamella apicola]|nr:HAMP domain-containing protein [Gilliamella apicola]